MHFNFIGKAQLWPATLLLNMRSLTSIIIRFDVNNVVLIYPFTMNMLRIIIQESFVFLNVLCVYYKLNK